MNNLEPMAEHEPPIPQKEMSQHDIDMFHIRCRDDFEYYAPRALKVKPKKGGLVDLKLNFCQTYLHKLAEHQLKTTGRIRIIVVKGLPRS